MPENKGDLISREALKKAIEQGEGFSWDSYGKDDLCVRKKYIDNAPTVEIPTELCKGCRFLEDCETCEEKLRPQGETVIKCKDCKYQVKEWREDKRMKENGYWVYGCKHFGEIMGYWGFGGNDNEFCSDAEQKGGTE